MAAATTRAHADDTDLAEAATGEDEPALRLSVDDDEATEAETENSPSFPQPLSLSPSTTRACARPPAHSVPGAWKRWISERRRWSTCIAVLLVALPLLSGLGIFVGLIIHSLLQGGQSFSVQSAHLNGLCEDRWAVAVRATAVNPARVPISLTSVRADVDLRWLMTVQLAETAQMTSGKCLHLLADLLGATAAAAPTWAAGGLSFQVGGSAAAVQVAVLDEAVWLSTGTSSLDVNLTVEPSMSSLLPLLSILSNLSTALQITSQPMLSSCSGSSLLVLVGFHAELIGEVSADARVTILSSDWTETVTDSLNVDVLDLSCQLSQLSFTCGSSASSSNANSSVEMMPELSVKMSDFALQLLPSVVSGSSAISAGGQIQIELLPDGLTVDFPPELQWQLQFDGHPLVNLTVLPSSLTMVQLLAPSRADQGWLSVSFNASVSATAAAEEVIGWRLALQQMLDDGSWPSLSSLGFTGNGHCTLSSLVDSRYLNPLALQLLLTSDSAQSTSSSELLADTDSAETDSADTVSVDWLSGIRLTAVDFDPERTTGDSLSVLLTVDFGGSLLATERVNLTGELPFIAILVNSSLDDNGEGLENVAASVSISSVSLFDGMYRLTFSVALDVLDKEQVSQTLLRALLSGVDVAESLLLALSLQAGQSSPPVAASALAGLTWSTSWSSFNGVAHMWSALLTLNDFWHVSTTPSSLLLQAESLFAWTNIIGLPEIDCPLTLFALPPDCDDPSLPSACDVSMDALGSLSLTFTTESSFLSQSLLLHGLLNLTAYNCTLQDWPSWQPGRITSPPVPSPCWQAYFAGRYVRNLDFQVPVLLRVMIGSFSVDVSYHSFSDQSMPVGPPLLQQGLPSSFGCAAIEPVSPNTLVGLLALSHSSGTVELWLPELSFAPSTTLDQLVNWTVGAVNVRVNATLNPSITAWTEATAWNQSTVKLALLEANVETAGEANEWASLNSTAAFCVPLPHFIAVSALTVGGDFFLSLLYSSA
jgi:hypothetical protein